ncbi:MAG: macrolide ABC transporter ATP-binding protein [Candidatus Wildermuthbacteria bacterium RIFCSPLOWO2_02_FULL_47_9c]|uniref:ABC transporter related protein n=2 Tax=Parcubacteria group TaxID=1794811 RepID=A0A837IKS7_9BACT|nr:MAG: ABC transporter related protein [Candidatus Yanofskybacteria bacterium GW2011_GWC1_48_11]KKW04464.1 MAG: ABC transporter related protein [Parcubacteria group bacterium GW2011_GWB1_49_12]KKW08606.1 MAG: ABC transporter related protein [Parcubacteria group bacterium GW2011_GWA1_49_26]KKW14082.1 MAG: ABC transporter related protein [Parcubacteria group bacterium GW2011_GWA2_50_10]OHA61584.1 MAG: macrolide ABC transporter ATP-binding protein [Candidatus Wildermuthbacteria bacterium GWA1_49_
MALIELENVEKTYDDGTQALRGISFRIEKGDFVAIMGPSGSGKSTVLHILGFLDRHTKGTYRFEGKTIDDYSDEELAHIRNQKMGFVFQAFNLLPRATVLENVMLPLLYSSTRPSLREQMAKEAIEAVGLSHRLGHLSSELSGGEKQRVAIARALVNKPEVIFADEPTGNLDSASGKIIMEILEDLNEKHGHTILLITHETYTAETAKRIVHILDGKVEGDNGVNQRRRAHDSFVK